VTLAKLQAIKSPRETTNSSQTALIHYTVQQIALALTKAVAETSSRLDTGKAQIFLLGVEMASSAQMKRIYARISLMSEPAAN
jgi:hypothetical protein